MNTESSSSTNSTTNQYYEHHLAYYKSHFFSTDSPEIYPHINEDYGLLGHTVTNIGEYGVLVLWSESELETDTREFLNHELEPDLSIYNWEKPLLKEAPMECDETITERLQDALWEGLKVYDLVMEEGCPEDQHDPANDHVQDVTNPLIPQIEGLGNFLGYAMDTVMTLIEDYHHHEWFESDRINETRRLEYDRLHEWLSGDRRTTSFQNLDLTGVILSK